MANAKMIICSLHAPLIVAAPYRVALADLSSTSCCAAVRIALDASVSVKVSGIKQ